MTGALEAHMQREVAELTAERDRLREELERARVDAERWRWLAPRMYSADFDYAENGIVALVFEMPEDTVFYADCNMTIDAARKPG